jgi:hypothetical protein
VPRTTAFATDPTTDPVPDHEARATRQRWRVFSCLHTLLNMPSFTFEFTVTCGLEFNEDGFFLRYVVTIPKESKTATVSCAAPRVGAGEWTTSIDEARLLYAAGLRLNRLRSLGCIPDGWSATLSLPDGTRPECRLNDHQRGSRGP